MFSRYYNTMPDPYGDDREARPLREPLVVRCRGSCGGTFEVRGFSAAAEADEYLCCACQTVVSEVGMGRLCAVCEKPKEQRYGRCECEDEAYVDEPRDEEELP